MAVLVCGTYKTYTLYLRMRSRGVRSKISYESETGPFPVQRGELYGSPELPQILSGSARYPVQRDPG